ncbi:MAG: DUF423 domain-containing protein [Maribacter sp.]
MKRWNFKTQSNPQTILKKMESALGPTNGFVFDIDSNKEDSVVFKLRKRVLHTSQVILNNSIIVNGNMSKTDVDNETTVEINFNQHLLLVLHISIWLGAGIFLIIAGIISNSGLMYVLGGASLVIALAIWIDTRKKFQNNIETYKTLITGILDS